jgi:hypothetical protein
METSNVDLKQSQLEFAQYALCDGGSVNDVKILDNQVNKQRILLRI